MIGDILIKWGLSSQRKLYLYKKIRPYVSSDDAKDILCPRPNTPPIEEPTINQNEIEENPVELPEKDAVIQLEVPSKKRKQIHCSFCKEPGHKNAVYNGIFKCPKRQSEENKV